MNSEWILRKDLPRIKVSLKLGGLSVKIHLPYQKKYGFTHIQKNVLIQDIRIHHAFIERLVRSFVFVTSSVAVAVNSVEDRIFAALIFVRL